MFRDAQATRTRLVDAAIAEFAARGLAGGRVDRIATAAAANKRAIYDYFTNKEGLFDAAVDRVIGRLNTAVTLDESDLPGYAGRLFDYLRAHPEAVRMITWRRLERPDTGSHLSPGFVAHVSAIRDSPATGGGARQMAPVDILILVIGLANAWDLSAADLLPAVGEDPGDPDRIATHRSAVVEAARRLSESTASSGSSTDVSLGHKVLAARAQPADNPAECHSPPGPLTAARSSTQPPLTRRPTRS